MARTNIQIGKNGLSENFFLTLGNMFRTHEQVKIVILKSAGHEKEKVREMNEKVLEKMGKRYTSKIVGFTIFLHKWRKDKR